MKTLILIALFITLIPLLGLAGLPLALFLYWIVPMIYSVHTS